MLEEEGRVTGIEGNYAFVAARPTSACEGCSQKGVCHVLGGSGDVIIKAINDMRAKVGDNVVVAISSKTFFKASALIYLLPVAALIAGGMMGKSIARSFDTSVSPELMSAILGFASLGLSFLIVKALAKKIGESGTDQARVVKVL